MVRFKLYIECRIYGIYRWIERGRNVTAREREIKNDFGFLLGVVFNIRMIVGKIG